MKGPVVIFMNIQKPGHLRKADGGGLERKLLGRSNLFYLGRLLKRVLNRHILYNTAFPSPRLCLVYHNEPTFKDFI